jgi:hypothetical protein
MFVPRRRTPAPSGCGLAVTWTPGGPAGSWSCPGTQPGCRAWSLAARGRARASTWPRGVHRRRYPPPARRPGRQGRLGVGRRRSRRLHRRLGAITQPGRTPDRALVPDRAAVGLAGQPSGAGQQAARRVGVVAGGAVVQGGLHPHPAPGLRAAQRPALGKHAGAGRSPRPHRAGPRVARPRPWPKPRWSRP